MYCIYIVYIFYILCIYIYCIYILYMYIIYCICIYCIYIHKYTNRAEALLRRLFHMCIYIYICGNIYVYGKKENMFDTENMTGVYCRYSLISTKNYELVNWVKRKISKIKSVSWSHLFQIKDFDKYVLKMRILPRRHTLHVDGWVRH